LLGFPIKPFKTTPNRVRCPIVKNVWVKESQERSRIMDTVTMREFFMWCTIINGSLLIFSFLICAVAGDWVYKMHTRWFNISRKPFDTILYCFLGAMKILVLMLNLVPYIALRMIT